MKQEVSINEAIGKTLEDFSFASISGQAVLVFTDGTFCTLGIRTEYEDQEIEGQKIELLDFGHDKLIALGIATKEELEKISATKQAELKARAQEYQRKQYELLKLQFEGKP